MAEISRQEAKKQMILDIQSQIDCKNIEERGARLLKTRDFPDCSLLVGVPGTKVLSHKLLLATASPAFERIFYGPEPAAYDVPLEHIDHDIFQLILEYIYTDNTSIQTLDQAAKLQDAAENLNMPHLSRKCAAFISLHEHCPIK